MRDGGGVHDSAEFQRVLETIRDAAGDAIVSGSATLEVTTVKALYGPKSAYDAPVAKLTPRNPRAAGIIIEVQHPNVWWISAADGPGFEFADDRPETWLDQLRDMVAAALAGAYEDEWRERPRRRLLVPWLWRAIPEWRGTFHASSGPISTSHIGYERPEGAPRKRRFEPY
jgi:hypothetical protein